MAVNFYLSNDLNTEQGGETKSMRSCHIIQFRTQYFPLLPMTEETEVHRHKIRESGDENTHNKEAI